jgi:hypothetical protein
MSGSVPVDDASLDGVAGLPEVLPNAVNLIVGEFYLELFAEGFLSKPLCMNIVIILDYYCLFIIS